MASPLPYPPVSPRFTLPAYPPVFPPSTLPACLHAVHHTICGGCRIALADGLGEGLAGHHGLGRARVRAITRARQDRAWSAGFGARVRYDFAGVG